MSKRELKEGDRVIDLMFPEHGPKRVEQHPHPHTVRDGRDKWLLVAERPGIATYWIGKRGAESQVELIEP